MEPAKIPIGDPYFRATIPTIVMLVEEETKKEWKSGFGKDAVFHDVSLGWFVLFQGLGSALYMGKEKPPIEKGDEVVIRIDFYAR